MALNVALPIRGSVRPAPDGFGSCPRRGDWRIGGGEKGVSDIPSLSDSEPLQR